MFGDRLMWWDLLEALWKTEYLSLSNYTPVSFAVSVLQVVLIAACIQYFVWKSLNSNEG